jgi:hypothetical protein
MKQLISLAALLQATILAHGQGTVKFFNDSTTLIYFESSSDHSIKPLPPNPGLFYFGLFSAPLGTADFHLFQFTGFHGTNQAVAGRFSGGVVAIPNQPAGTHLEFLVQAWSANMGTTWAAARAFMANPTSAYLFGRSQIASEVILGGGAIPVGTIFSTVSLGTTPGFLLPYPWPEPSTGSLMGLGLGVLLLRLRQRSL